MRVRISEYVHCEQVEDEAVLLDLASGTYFGLDAVGARLWSLLVELGSTEAAAAVAQDEYNVDATTLERDLVDFVQGLSENGLVTLDGSPGCSPS